MWLHLAAHVTGFRTVRKINHYGVLTMFHLKKLTLAMTVVVGFAGATAGSLFAADLGDSGVSYKDEPMQSFSWTGFYFGGNAGYAFSGEGDKTDLFRNENANLGPLDIGGIGELEADGGFVGLQAGYNMQRGRFVFGIEGDIQAGDINDDKNSPNFSNVPAFFGEADTNVNFFGTIRGRLGFAMDRTLLFVTGGYAFADVDYRLEATNRGGNPVGNTVTFDESDTRSGYVLGGGAEYALRDNLTIKLEYQYLDFDDETYKAQSFTTVGAPSGVFYDSKSELDLHTVKVGVNYKLN